MPKKAMIIGAGPSGLTAACVLADQGYEVTILEKNAYLGGRLKSENWSGHVVATGPTWVHDSSHPIMGALKGGVYQEFNQERAESGFFSAYANFYIGKRLFLKLSKEIEAILLKHVDQTFDLSWYSLISEIVKKPDANTTAYALEMRALFDKLPYNKYLNLKKPEEVSSTLLNLLRELDVDLDQHSVIGSQNYMGFGDTLFLPTGGYSQVIQRLHDEVKKRPQITIKTNTSVTQVIKNSTEAEKGSLTLQVNSEGKTESYTGDKVVFAIAKHDFNTISRDSEEEKRTNDALGHLLPSYRSKLVMRLNHNVALDYSDTRYLPGDLTRFMFTTQGGAKENSPILYALVYSWDLKKLCESATGPGVDAPNFGEGVSVIPSPKLVERIKGLFPNIPDLAVEEMKVFYSTGESWYRQHIGFKPVSNAENDILYLGPVTGCDDAVHAVCSRACLELGVDPNQYLSKLFAPPTNILTVYAQSLLLEPASIALAAVKHQLTHLTDFLTKALTKTPQATTEEEKGSTDPRP